jgi:hypothetical protein
VLNQPFFSKNHRGIAIDNQRVTRGAVDAKWFLENLLAFPELNVALCLWKITRIR